MPRLSTSRTTDLKGATSIDLMSHSPRLSSVEEPLKVFAEAGDLRKPPGRFNQVSHLQSLLRCVTLFYLPPFLPRPPNTGSPPSQGVLRQTCSVMNRVLNFPSSPDSTSQGWDYHTQLCWVFYLSLLPSVTPTNYFESTTMCLCNL